ncbi:MFS transporter [Cellulomonas hominis]|uniref:MFS transporter n=1 Tax=Cellulomonas hominis TaxID=156981 RepID=UPI001443FA7E|nr:MFS transporter [Cellulomonas hominis]MBU5422596.1 MFS transporter [Cellulomonas hominis]NKY10627.1 MFS transporter [Cellulomonas hominis]
MSLAPYARLLRLPGVLPLVLVAFVARIPHAMTGVVLTLHVVGPLGQGYGRAGVVAAAMTVGVAIGSPWRGRRVDRLGLRRALIPSVVVESAVWLIAPRLGYEALVVAAVVAGAFLVPVFSVVRQSLAVLVPAEQQKTAYALDSVGTEMTFMLAPTVGVLIATQVSTTAALTVIGVSTVVAGLVLMWFNPPTRSPGEAPGAAASGPRQRILTPGLLVVLAAASAAALILNGTDVGIVAALRGWEHESAVGWMIALWCLGSVVGGLVYGAGRHELHPLALVALLGAATLPATFAQTQAQLAVAVVVAGLPCAAALSSINASLVRMVPEHRRGEVMGWSGTANTVGAALGAPVIGAVIDGFGPWSGFAAAGGVGLLLSVLGLAVLAVVRRRAGARGARGAGAVVPTGPAPAGVVPTPAPVGADDVPARPEQPAAR